MFEDRPICDRCGKRILYPKRHKNVCNPKPAFDGECPMCGQPYEGYLRHLEDCPARR